MGLFAFSAVGRESPLLGGIYVLIAILPVFLRLTWGTSKALHGFSGTYVAIVTVSLGIGALVTILAYIRLLLIADAFMILAMIAAGVLVVKSSIVQLRKSSTLLIVVTVLCGVGYFAFAYWATWRGGFEPAKEGVVGVWGARSLGSRIVGFSWEYRRSHGAFPSLETVKNSVKGSKELNHLRVSYETDATHLKFTIDTRNIWYPHRPVYEITESGIIRENGRVQGLNAASIRWISTCLFVAQKENNGSFPRTLRSAFYPSVPHGCGIDLKRFIGDNSVQSDRYVAVYDPQLNAGRISTFQLHESPLAYNNPFIRSYYTDESGVIRGTGEPRGATAGDPEVPTNEIDGYISHSERKISP